MNCIQGNKTAIVRIVTMARICCGNYLVNKNIYNTVMSAAVQRRWFTQQGTMYIFDRKAKCIQRNRTTLMKDYEVYDYVKEEFGYRMYDRICDIKRTFNVMIDLGCGRGHFTKHLTADTVTEKIIQCDSASEVLNQAAISPEVPTEKLVVDEELLPFDENSIDIFVSNLSLHWVNDLPGCFKQVNNCLKPDGAFLGAMFGGETLFELRVSLQLAESELEGGVGSHVSPFAECQDIGSLLNRTNFTLLTLDMDELVVNYPSVMELMRDLKGMGESNCAKNRKTHLHRKTVKRASEIYSERFGNKDGSVPATFQVINFIGWKRDPSQLKAAQRGSGQVSIKDLDKLDQIAQDYKIFNTDEDKKDDT